MFRTSDQDYHTARLELESAEAELAELQRQLRTFESQVDTRLGALLDQLSELNADTTTLDEQLRHIRQQRLFGSELMSYLAGAPQPGRPTRLDNLPPQELQFKQTPASQDQATPVQANTLPDIKTLYRRLARRYHPDLARNAADRAQADDLMKTINQAYAAGDLPALMKLAGLSLPYGMETSQAAPKQTATSRVPKDTPEWTITRLREVRQQMNELSNLPIVKLSLDVKLARHQRRDLLGELAAELQYKVARKTAERDYLRSQIDASQRASAP
ncbi:MAG: hypothetical protein C3F13_04115 [Anaerolineales bacterium]|nr:MAG: hypothetical protein C3F13_04115 [Anaerolineales bacterium]